MASNYTIMLVEEEEILGESIGEINAYCSDGELLAVDCEGVNLSRHGELTLLTVATRGKVYIYDILKLGRTVFDKGMRELLEKKSVEKLMFDCREDADILWHKFDVRLRGVLDLQLLEVMHRRRTSLNTKPMEAGKIQRRSALTDDVEHVYGFSQCIELYIKDENLFKTKKEGTNKMKIDAEIWKKRPLTDQLQEYCCVDTRGLLTLYDKFKENGSDDDLLRLRVASERYADIRREKASRTMDEFERNAFLPLDIIPENNAMAFPYASTLCTKCKRHFPLEEFSKNQLRNKEQKCRVCKKVKLRMDVQANRESNWERDEARVDLFDYYSDSDDGYGFLYRGYDSDDHYGYDSDDYGGFGGYGGYDSDW